MLKNMGLIHWLVKSMSKEVGRLPEKKKEQARILQLILRLSLNMFSTLD